MNRTLRLPLIPIFIVYTIGIYLGHFNLPFHPQGLILFLSVLLVLWALFIVIKRARLGFWIALLFFLVFGIFSIRIYLEPPRSPSHISQFHGFDQIRLEGIVDRPPHRSSDGTRLLIRPEKAILSNRHIPVDGYLLLFLKEECEPLSLGNRLPTHISIIPCAPMTSQEKDSKALLSLRIT